MDTQPAFELLVRLVSDVTFLPFAVGFVVALTALLKRVIPPQTASAAHIALTVQVIVWAAWTLARRGGIEAAEFQGTLDALTTLVSGVAMLVASSAGAKLTYDGLKRGGVPFFGEERRERMSNE